ncbi:MAG: PAS domain S-box protein [Deltaproteobacteria bacterium]|nr:PAS domain S-box protein [Deltaproteobacteria bacterium]
MMDDDRKKISSIFEALEDGVYIVDDDYNVEYMNDVMIKDFGQGVGKKCYQIYHARENACPWCRTKEVFKGKSVQRDYHDERLGKAFDIIEFPLKNEDGTISKVSIFRGISGIRESVDRLKVAEEDYKRLFEHSGAGVYVSSKEGKFLNANQAILDMLGYDSKEEFLKIDIAEDLYLRREDRRKFQDLIERDGRVIDYEVEFKRKDGSPIPVLLTSHVRYDQYGNILGYEGINIDQSHRKEMENRLREAHDFLNKVIQSSPNAIIASDLEGNIKLWNRGAEETLGYKAEDVIGKMNIRKIYQEGVATKVMKMMRGMEYGGVGILRSYPMVHLRQDGEIVDGNLSAAIIYNSHGKEIASVGIFVDLQERLAMERKLMDTQEMLLQSEKLAAMGKLTSQIAHELNNPLYGIMNTLELLKTEVSPQSKRRKILDMALSETERLTDLLRKMLSFSKPDEEERQPTDINTILDEILLLVGKQLQENSIRISSSLTDGINMVLASKNQLRQVFLNMIANARDAMPDGGTLTIKSYEKGEKIFVELTDTGIGIKEEDISKIFDAFFTTKDSVKDVGLGLSVCYGFIQEHEGDILVSSHVGSGSTFTIILPKHKEQGQD